MSYPYYGLLVSKITRAYVEKNLIEKEVKRLPEGFYTEGIVVWNGDDTLLLHAYSSIEKYLRSVATGNVYQINRVLVREKTSQTNQFIYVRQRYDEGNFSPLHMSKSRKLSIIIGPDNGFCDGWVLAKYTSKKRLCNEVFQMFKKDLIENNAKHDLMEL